MKQKLKPDDIPPQAAPTTRPKQLCRATAYDIRECLCHELEKLNKEEAINEKQTQFITHTQS